ncbi:MAG TPA: SDR family NAD(P)-dependent oxidoreductase [Micromonosporaceae bacterium]|nr:SDR family NAD(P)-dependent oxidoreductase [Micromonosporaceae bacterium]
MEDLTAPRIIVVTGASSGIGLAAAEELARRGHQVALVGRDKDRLDTALSLVRRAASGPAPAAFQADFAVLDEVRALAERLAGAYPRIDVLANNAGALVPRRVTTVDGFEATVQTNHLAAFLLTHLLRGRLTGGRVVNTSSQLHRGLLDPDDLSLARRRYVPLLTYASSKQANILFATEAARRWPDVLSTSFSPGTVRTRFGSDSWTVGPYFRIGFWLRTPAKGAETLVWLAEAPAGELVNGGHYVDRKVRRARGQATDPALASRLWDASLAAVGLA